MSRRTHRLLEKKEDLAPPNRTIIALVNTKSGSAAETEVDELFDLLDEVLNSRPQQPRVFDLIADGGCQRALKFYQDCKDLVVIACGGDGTVAWVLNEIDRIAGPAGGPALAIIPLGTGNDMARFLGYGSSFTPAVAENIVSLINSGEAILLDRWEVRAIKERNEEDLFVFYNYFSVGFDAEVALDFHKARRKHPHRFTGRLANMFEYARISFGKLFEPRHLLDSVGYQLQLWVDDEHVNQEEVDKADGLLFLNIDMYAAGTKPWKGMYLCSTVCAPGERFEPQRCDDGLLEVIGFRYHDLARIRWGQPARRLAQGSRIKLVLKCELAFELDGEPSVMPACTIFIERKNQARMIRVNRKSCGCF